VLQGERERARDNWSLGKFTLEFESAPRGVPRVGVQFEIDANGILHVLARDLKTGRQKLVEMKSAVDVDDAAVQAMVEESVEHAFEDLAARRWVEASLRARETLAATRKGLVDFAGELDASARQSIEAAAGEVDAALATEKAESQVGDTQRLKTAGEALDEATRPLAELMMDQAMAAMLRKRGLID
jgi:molecular chaperone DnaK